MTQASVLRTAPSSNRPRQAGLWVCAPMAALVLLTAGLLWQNRTQLDRHWPASSSAMAELKKQLAATKDPQAAEAMIPHIRQADLDLRQQYFSLRQQQLWGGYLLLAELAVLATLLHQSLAIGIAPAKPAQEPEPTRRLKSALVLRNVLGLATCGLLAVAVAANFLSTQRAAPIETAKAPLAAAPSAAELAANWSRFRGPDGSGISPLTDLPDDWDGATGKNILWKTPLELEGASSPVIWGKKVFLTAASKSSPQAYCFDADSGKLLWQQEVPTSQRQAVEVMEDTGFAAPTPATDGRVVATIFATGDLGCYDLDGHLLWTRSLGPLDSTYGYASSLTIYKDLLIVLLDEGAGPEDNKSRIAAFNLLTGLPVWETKRPVGGSWASPIIAATPTGDQCITVATPWVISYAAQTGKELWRAELLSPDVAPSPIYAGGLVYVVNAGSKLAAIKPDGQGDVTRTHVAWSAEDGLPDVVSPISDGKLLLLTTSGGRLTYYRCTGPDAGKVAAEKQLDDLVFRPSPVLAGDKLYLLAKDGTMVIVRWGEGFEEIRRCNLNESCKASPAVASGRIFIRTEKNLWCIGTK